MLFVVGGCCSFLCLKMLHRFCGWWLLQLFGFCRFFAMVMLLGCLFDNGFWELLFDNRFGCLKVFETFSFACFVV